MGTPLAACQEVFAFIQDVLLHTPATFRDLLRCVGDAAEGAPEVADALVAVKRGQFPEPHGLHRLIALIRDGGFEELFAQDPERASDPGGREEKQRAVERGALCSRGGRDHPFAPRPSDAPALPLPWQLGHPQRYRMRVAYNGRPFRGWQRQADGVPTVQQTLEDAARRLLRHMVHVCAASRTDAGVSATGQLCHLDAVTDLPASGLRVELNALLPATVRILDLSEVADDFAAMRNLWKRYRYVIPADWATAWAPLTSPGDAWPLDVGAMRRAADLLVGTHDFAAFQTGHRPGPTVRTLYACHVEATSPTDEVHVVVVGDGFLRRAVRCLAGTLWAIGAARCRLGDVTRALDLTDRSLVGPTLPAEGLCLEHVEVDVPWDGGAVTPTLNLSL